MQFLYCSAGCSFIKACIFNLQYRARLTWIDVYMSDLKLECLESKKTKCCFSPQHVAKFHRVLALALRSDSLFVVHFYLHNFSLWCPTFFRIKDLQETQKLQFLNIYNNIL